MSDEGRVRGVGLTFIHEREEKGWREELDIDDLGVREGDDAGVGLCRAAYPVDDRDGGPVEED